MVQNTAIPDFTTHKLLKNLNWKLTDLPGIGSNRISYGYESKVIYFYITTSINTIKFLKALYGGDNQA